MVRGSFQTILALSVISHKSLALKLFPFFFLFFFEFGQFGLVRLESFNLVIQQGKLKLLILLGKVRVLCSPSGAPWAYK